MKLDFKSIKFPKFPKRSSIALPSSPLDLRKIATLDRDHYRSLAYGLGAVIVLMVVAGLAAFLLSIRGSEQTMVPEIRGMELSQALVKMQDKELYPRVSLRFTDNPADRGLIVDQSPRPGSIVKAGRRIQITVSKGAVADTVENFVGQDLNEVKIHLQNLFASTKPLLAVKEPPIYLFDRSPAGTVLEQKPLPGTAIAGLTPLELVVSRGPEKPQLLVPDLQSLSYEAALAQVQKGDLVVTFTMRNAAGKEKAGVVVAQTPAALSLVPANARLAVTVTPPAEETGLVAGIYSRELPEYPYPLKVSLEAVGPAGDRTPIVTANHPGGLFTAPYQLPAGHSLVLSVLDRESPPRFEVRAEAGAP
jgi:beta-lactam-binding protein with PASTA domain